MPEPLTLYGFVERVARLREAQRCGSGDPHRTPGAPRRMSGDQRQMAATLEAVVDALVLLVGQRAVLLDEFREFAGMVEGMRAAQRGRAHVRESASTTAALEAVVDERVRGYVLEVKALNAKLQGQYLKNSCLLQPCNGQKVGFYGKNGDRAGRAHSDTKKAFENAQPGDELAGDRAGVWSQSAVCL